MNFSYIKEAKYGGLHLQRILTLTSIILIYWIGTASSICACHLDNSFPVGHTSFRQ